MPRAKPRPFGQQRARPRRKRPAQAQADPASPFVQEAVQSLKNNDLRSARPWTLRRASSSIRTASSPRIARLALRLQAAFARGGAAVRARRGGRAQDVSIKFYLADIKMAEGDYAAARTIYAAMEQTPGRRISRPTRSSSATCWAARRTRRKRNSPRSRRTSPRPPTISRTPRGTSRSMTARAPKSGSIPPRATFTMTLNEPYAQALRNIGYLPAARELARRHPA